MPSPAAVEEILKEIDTAQQGVEVLRTEHDGARGTSRETPAQITVRVGIAHHRRRRSILMMQPHRTGFAMVTARFAG